MILALVILLLLFSTKSIRETTIPVVCDTTKGPLTILVKPDWSPNGAKRFLQLVDEGYYNGVPLFRCISGFVCQFGPVPQKPNVHPSIPDDSPRADLRPFKAGYVSFAGYAPDSRSTHVFMALDAVPSLGTQPWETPFGVVTDETMGTLRSFFTSYGESAPTGQGPEAQKIEAVNGNDYLKGFPQLDYLRSCVR